jgi:hypothetical protein
MSAVRSTPEEQELCSQQTKPQPTKDQKGIRLFDHPPTSMNTRIYIPCQSPLKNISIKKILSLKPPDKKKPTWSDEN